MGDTQELIAIQRQMAELHIKAQKKARGFTAIFGTMTKLEREKRGMTQQELADLIGLSRTQITNIEGGGSSTTLINCIRICAVLGRTPNEMLGYEKDA